MCKITDMLTVEKILNELIIKNGGKVHFSKKENVSDEEFLKKFKKFTKVAKANSNIKHRNSHLNDEVIKSSQEFVGCLNINITEYI